MDAQLKYLETKLAYEIDAWDANQAVQNNEKVLLLDARSPESYKEEHIADAINFHHRTMNEETVKKLDPSFLYIVYCTGIGCNASTKGAYNLVKYGFKVKELIGGLEWWIKDGYETEGIKVQQNVSV